MRVATFNILHGRTVGDGVHLDRLRRAISLLDPDILALQEVDFGQTRSGRADLTAVAADVMNAVTHRFVAAITGTPGATWIAATGEERPESASYGIALLSRYPAISWQVLRLPRIPTRFPMYLQVPGRVMIVNEEPRAAVLARVDTPLGAMTIAGTHLSFVPGWNRHQLRRLARTLRALPGPHVIAGDLNMVADPAVRWSGMRSLVRVDTFPANAPGQQLDHILTDSRQLTVIRHATPEVELSDHRPLVVTVTRH